MAQRLIPRPHGQSIPALVRELQRLRSELEAALKRLEDAERRLTDGGL